jgi:1-deoxy-D-xylulose-5-phosphate reductoisomerase
MKKIVLLGATGSIGMQTIDIIRNNPDKFQLVGFSYGYSHDLAKELENEFKPSYVLSADASQDELTAMVTGDYDILLNAVVGAVGLQPTLAAIRSGHDVAIANKETLVVAGDFIMPEVVKHGVKLLPVDSEHAAIFQVMQGVTPDDVRSLTITASGGSFRDKTRGELEGVTVEEALNHPNWSMGAKITIDSATMVNKGLEVIEAHHLFQMPYDKIDVIQHRESVVHSMITLQDGAMLAQLGASDMREPIQYALTYPHHEPMVNEKPFDLAAFGQLHFEKMDFERFPMLALAYEVGRKGGSYPAVYNAANEVANQAFREGKMTFLEIESTIQRAVAEHEELGNLTLDAIIELDQAVRQKVASWFA